MDIKELANKIEVIIKSAGETVLQMQKQGNITVYKKKDKSLVTNVDRMCEQYLIKELSHLIPNVGFYAEESGESKESFKHISPYCFIIDPIDGTTNFIAGLSHFCISVALSYDSEVVFGVVYNPSLKEYYSAMSGFGAFCNGKQLLIEKKRDMLIVLINQKLLYKHKDRINNMERSDYVFRYLGSAALDIVYIAAGRVDAVLYEKLAWWDVAASQLILQEAGGKITDFLGNKIKKGNSSVLAGSKDAYELFKKSIICTNES